MPIKKIPFEKGCDGKSRPLIRRIAPPNGRENLQYAEKLDDQHNQILSILAFGRRLDLDDWNNTFFDDKKEVDICGDVQVHAHL
jgi:hypothetical protein